MLSHSSRCLASSGRRAASAARAVLASPARMALGRKAPGPHRPGMGRFMPRPAAAANGNGVSQDRQPQRPVLIFNPVAGQEAATDMLGRIALRLGNRFPQLTIMVTQPDVHAEALAQRALEQGADLVVASGGDGTIAAVAGVLRGSGVPLGIVPRGTANGFSVALGIPTHLDDGDEFAERACDVITDGHVALVDMALVTTSEATDVPCILLTGVGFEAEVVEGADRSMKDMLGVAAYIISGGATLLKGGGNFHAKITVDGEVHEGEIGALTIANSAPPTSVLAHGHVGDCIPDDGLLEVVGYVASDSTLENFMGMTRLAVRVMMGDGDGDGSAPVQDEERVFGGRAKEIIVETDPPQKVVVDGELLGTTPLTARVQPASLQVYVPRLDPQVAEALGSDEEEGGPIKGAASAAATSAPRATTGVGMEASAAVQASFEALDRQKQEQE